MPLSGYSTGGDPKDEGEKPKKEKPDDKKASNKTTEDSLDIYESENKVLNNVEIPNYDRPSNNRETTNTNNKRLRQNINDNTEAEEDDPNSAMSFNIIYYIIYVEIIDLIIIREFSFTAFKILMLNGF